MKQTLAIITCFLLIFEKELKAQMVDPSRTSSSNITVVQNSFVANRIAEIYTSKRSTNFLSAVRNESIVIFDSIITGIGGCPRLITNKKIVDIATCHNNPVHKWVLTSKGYFNTDIYDVCWQSIQTHELEIKEAQVYFYDESIPCAGLNLKWKVRTDPGMKYYDLTNVTADSTDPHKA